MTSLLAAAAVAVFAQAFTDSQVLSSPLGAPRAVSAVTAAVPTLCGPELTDAPLSSLANGAGGGLGHACACPAQQRSTLWTASAPAPVAVPSDTPGATVASQAAAQGVSLAIVHARAGEHGTVDVTGHPDVAVDRRVLAIIARELAFPRLLGRGTPIEAVYRQEEGRARVTAVTIGKGIAARHAFYFRSRNATAEGFFARDGKSLEYRFLRYPLAFDLVTSPFSASRMHPVFFAWRPHNGVDFAARPGTPVLAVGSGTVKEARWEGRYGRTVAIEHESGYVSRYSHLQGFASTVRAGAPVRKGQVIGFVGMSGLTTGPHLHFSMLKNGVYLDPLGADLPKRASLDAKAVGQFRSTVARLERALAAATDGRSTQVAVRTPPAGRAARSGG